MPKYQSIPLTTQDYNSMSKLENKIGCIIPVLDQEPLNHHIKSETFGFIALNSFVKSLGLYNCKLYTIPEEIFS
ncbi:MAG: hypothetical protein ACFFD1_07360, partial [Candidatus Thorarchaeota archaeon]